MINCHNLTISRLPSSINKKIAHRAIDAKTATNWFHDGGSKNEYFNHCCRFKPLT